MPKLRSLPGKEVVDIFLSLGFEVVSQRGSYVKLQRLKGEMKQTLTIPNHRELDRGTLRAIHRQALRYVSEKDLHPHFYSE